MEDINICDDENTEFLKNSGNYGKCYVCLSYTLLRSPCDCESPICTECFNNVLKKNGTICTICKNNFNEDIIKDIKIEISDDESEISDESFDDESENNDSKNILTIIKIVSGLTIIPFLGFFFNKSINNNQLYIFTLENFIIGAFIFSFIALILFFFYYLSIFLKSFCNFFFHYCCLNDQ